MQQKESTKISERPTARATESGSCDAYQSGVAWQRETTCYEITSAPAKNVRGEISKENEPSHSWAFRDPVSGAPMKQIEYWRREQEIDRGCSGVDVETRKDPAAKN